MFQWLSKHLEFRQNTLLHVIFSTLFSVFGYLGETLSFVFDILLQSDLNLNLIIQAFSTVTQTHEVFPLIMTGGLTIPVSIYGIAPCLNSNIKNGRILIKNLQVCSGSTAAVSSSSTT